MKIKVLLVDDTAGVRDVYSLVLKSAGYEVVTADDGMKAKALLSVPGHGVNVVVTDTHRCP